MAAGLLFIIPLWVTIAVLDDPFIRIILLVVAVATTVAMFLERRLASGASDEAPLAEAPGDYPEEYTHPPGCVSTPGGRLDPYPDPTD